MLCTVAVPCLMASAKHQAAPESSVAHACNTSHHEAEQRAVAVDEEAVLGVPRVRQDLQHPVQVVHCAPHLRCTWQ